MMCEMLGEGSFGKVYLAYEKNLYQTVAIQMISKKDFIDDKDMDCICQEIKNQSCLHHPKLVKIFGYFYDEEYVYLILEYAPDGGIGVGTPFSEEVLAKYIQFQQCLDVHSFQKCDSSRHQA